MIFRNKVPIKDESLSIEALDAEREEPLYESVVGPHMTIRGDLYSPGEIEVHGKVIGNIVCRDLTLGLDPEVTSEITADSVRICGRFDGQIQARNVVLTRTASVSGEIRHSSLEIEPGAAVEGDIRHVAPEELPSYEDWFIDEEEEQEDVFSADEKYREE